MNDVALETVMVPDVALLKVTLTLSTKLPVLPVAFPKLKLTPELAVPSRIWMSVRIV